MCNVFLILIDESAEKHRYTESLNREKKSFELLYNIQKSLVISLPDTKQNIDEAKAIDLKLFTTDSRQLKKELNTSSDDINMITSMKRLHKNNTQNHLKNHSQNISNNQNQSIIVDVREFRSPLPSLLYNHSFKIIPRTLMIGDYILSNEICIERKGISDLFSSFISGRLYNQIEGMTKHYKIVCLLIEFTLEKSFSLQSISDITSDISSSSINTKLIILCQTFPHLKILWSRSVKYH